MILKVYSNIKFSISDNEDQNKVLSVKEIDLCFKPNGLHHRTEQYYALRQENKPQLVVRRGQHFQVDIVLSRGYDPNKDAISFIFTDKSK